MDGDFDYLIKFLCLGNSGVGKTTYINQYINSTFDSRYFTTVGIDFAVKKLICKIRGQEKRLCLQIWDTAGQERSLTTSYYRESMGFIILFDLTNEQSFLDVRSWLEQLKLYAYSDTPDMLLCGNKSDLQEERAISKNDAAMLAKTLGLPYIETSAATGENVSTSIELLIDLVIKRIESTTLRSLLSDRQTSTINLYKNNNYNSRCFC